MNQRMLDDIGNDILTSGDGRGGDGGLKGGGWGKGDGSCTIDGNGAGCGDIMFLDDYEINGDGGINRLDCINRWGESMYPC